MGRWVPALTTFPNPSDSQMMSRKAPSVLSWLMALWALHTYQPTCVRLAGSSCSSRSVTPLLGLPQASGCPMLPGKGLGLHALPHYARGHHDVPSAGHSSLSH